MSLRIWLPLNGDLKNNGISNVEATAIGTIINNNGKIGKCYEFLISGSYITLPKEAMNDFDNECTVCFWIKILSWNASYATFFQAGTNYYAWKDYIFGVSRNASNSNMCFTIGDGSSNSSNNYQTSTLELNTWYHMVFRYKQGECAIYINGSLDRKYNTSIIPDFSKITNIAIGKANPLSVYQTNCDLNDLRIYDHALSEKEIKKISQGLILHYPLNRNGFGQENLITQAMINADPWKSAIANTITVDGITGWVTWNRELYRLTNKGNNNIFPGLTYEENTQYTLSLKWRDDYRTDGKSSSLHFRFKYSDGTHSQIISPKIDYWQEDTLTSTAGKTISAITTTYGNSGQLLIADLKLEKGSKKTPYSPIVNSNEYNMVGLDDNIEYDMSGFGNNGTRFNTFDWDSNTSKYNISTIFNGNNNAIQTPDLTTMITDKNYTISCWFYKTVIGTKGYQTIYGGPSGFELEARNAAGTNPQIVAWNWGKPTATYEFNTWNHFAFVHSDSDCKVYLNGILISTGSAKSSNPTGNYFIGSWNTATQQNFDGCISDFRIYATALSQADIAELYSIHRS